MVDKRLHALSRHDPLYYNTQPCFGGALPVAAATPRTFSLKMKARKIIKWIIGGLLVVIAIPAVAPFVGFQWSPINCRYQDIDLDTGRARYTTMIYGIPFSQDIKHTAISSKLAEVDLNRKDGTWRRVNTFSPGTRYSPHHGFHSALHQVKQLEMIWELEEHDDQARMASARAVLRLWQESDRDSGADDYIAGLMSP